MNNAFVMSPSERWRRVIGARGVPGIERGVLNALAYHADQQTLEAWPSLETLAQESGFSKDTVRRAIRALEKLGAITIIARSLGGQGHPHRYRINLDEPLLTATVKPSPPATVAESNGCYQRHERLLTATQTLADSHPNRAIEQGYELNTGHHDDQPNLKTRRIKQLAIPQSLPDWVDKQAWSEWCEHRRQIRKPMTPLAETKLVQALQKLIDAGHDQRTVIDHSIANGWQGLFAPGRAAIPQIRTEVRRVAADY